MFSFEHVEIRILQASSFPVSPGHVVSTLAKAITMPGVGVEGSVPPSCSAPRVPSRQVEGRISSLPLPSTVLGTQEILC